MKKERMFDEAFYFKANNNEPLARSIIYDILGKMSTNLSTKKEDLKELEKICFDILEASNIDAASYNEKLLSDIYDGKFELEKEYNVFYAVNDGILFVAAYYAGKKPNSSSNIVIKRYDIENDNIFICTLSPLIDDYKENIDSYISYLAKLEGKEDALSYANVSKMIELAVINFPVLMVTSF